MWAATTIRRLPLAALLLVLGCSGNHLAAGGGAGGGLGGDAGGSGSGSGSGTGSGTPVPFVAAPKAQSLRKVKLLMTGQAPDATEAAAYETSDAALGDMVAKWQQSDAFRATLRDFFNVQFQQTQATADQVAALASLRNGPDTALLLAMRSSFGRTMLALIDEGAPFTEAVTTNRFMMTTSMMSYYAFHDTRPQRWARDANFGFTIQSTRGPISLTDAATPESPNYLTFYVPNLPNLFTSMKDPTQRASCASVNPLEYSPWRTWAGTGVWPWQLWNILHNGGSDFSYPDNDTTYFHGGVHCFIDNTGVNIQVASDLNDWRMVEVRAPGAGEHPTEFFDLERMRNGNLLLAYTPRVGFFTTDSFLAQWGNNNSNSHRAAANQTLIAALGGAMLGADRLPLTTPTAVDANHAATPACFSCHEALDPMRQYFRQTFATDYSLQTDATTKAIPADFSFMGTLGGGTGVNALGQILAGHPQFARAWTLKLCAWANSAPCESGDPEVQRIADAFASSNFQFGTLVQQLFTSPLVTYRAATQTAVANGQVVSIARRSQLCNALSTRLGTQDICQLQTGLPDGSDSLPSRAAAMPGDGYSRGAESSLYVTTPDPFYLGNVENICALAAKRAVDGDLNWASGSDPNTALQKMVTTMLAASADEQQVPLDALGQHVQQAKAAGASPTDALRSAFVAACNSAASISVGI